MTMRSTDARGSRLGSWLHNAQTAQLGLRSVKRAPTHAHARDAGSKSVLLWPSSPEHCLGIQQCKSSTECRL